MHARIMLSAPGSGSGKTLLTCGILRALQRRKFKLFSFKSGPDYIDPMFHAQVLGVPCCNLDSFFLDQQGLRQLFLKQSQAADLSVIEGVMGYYDGIGGISTECSSYALAENLKLPVILIVSCRGMSASIAALVKGFVQYKTPSGICGVILNQLPASLYAPMKALVERETGIAVFGYLPVLKEMKLESRYLGLCMPEEIKDLQERLDHLAEKLEETLDLDALVRIAQSAELPDQTNDLPVYQEWTENTQKIVIGVARDSAFCFFYQANLDLLEELGVELQYFSPLEDAYLPEGIHGLWLPGGYPELYAKKLSKNAFMRDSIKNAVSQGLPTVAECGGFLYLHQSLQDMEGQAHPMVGAIAGDARKTKSLQPFGYIYLEPQQDTMLFRVGEQIPSHEFHYWTSTDCGNRCMARKASGTASWSCVHANETLYAGFPHLYLPANVEMAKRLIRACTAYAEVGKAGFSVTGRTF